MGIVAAPITLSVVALGREEDLDSGDVMLGISGARLAAVQTCIFLLFRTTCNDSGSWRRAR